MDELQPTKGFRNCNRRVRIGYFAQHHVDALGTTMATQCSLNLIQQRFPGTQKAEFDSQILLCAGKHEDWYRSALARFGVDSTLASQPIVALSGGQKSRLAFALIAADR